MEALRDEERINTVDPFQWVTIDKEIIVEHCLKLILAGKAFFALQWFCCFRLRGKLSF